MYLAYQGTVMGDIGNQQLKVLWKKAVAHAARVIFQRTVIQSKSTVKRSFDQRPSLLCTTWRTATTTTDALPCVGVQEQRCFQLFGQPSESVRKLVRHRMPVYHAATRFDFKLVPVRIKLPVCNRNGLGIKFSLELLLTNTVRICQRWVDAYTSE